MTVKKDPYDFSTSINQGAQHSSFWWSISTEIRRSFSIGKWWSVYYETSGQFKLEISGQFDRFSHVFKSDAITELNKVVNFMIKYTDVSIEIGSHTDCRDKSENNLILSQKRSQATLNDIVKQGISPSRLKAKGYGETRPLNECVDGIKCSEDKCQVNR